jgi:hypothetical protein
MAHLRQDDPALARAAENAHPWQALTQDCTQVTHQQVRGGHVQLWAGTLPGTDRADRFDDALSET